MSNSQVERPESAATRLMKSPTFPVKAAGCRVYRDEEGHGDNLFAVSSFGRFGGHHVTVFGVDGDAADIQLISKHGRYRRTSHPTEPLKKHVQALRALGFTELIELEGRRYDISQWPIRRKDD
jgi:hypothetical protein